MNIRFLQELLSRMEEIKIIGRNAEIDGVVCNVVGVVRYGIQLRLLILEFDEYFQQQIEEKEISELCNNPCKPESNRIILKSRQQIDATQLFRAVKSVFIGEEEFEVHGLENRRLSVQC